MGMPAALVGMSVALVGMSVALVGMSVVPKSAEPLCTLSHTLTSRWPCSGSSRPCPAHSARPTAHTPAPGSWHWCLRSPAFARWLRKWSAFEFVPNRLMWRQPSASLKLSFFIAGLSEFRSAVSACHCAMPIKKAAVQRPSRARQILNSGRPYLLIACLRCRATKAITPKPARD